MSSLGTPACFKVCSDSAFCIVFLNPDFSVLDFQMRNDAVVAMFVIPAESYERVLISLTVE
jgi:hypothetical protein